MRADPKIGVAMVLLAAALWGTTGTAQTFSSGALSSYWFGALRLVVASAFFAIYVAATSRRPRAPGIGHTCPLSGLLAAGACMAAYNLAFFAGIRSSGVAVGTAIAIGSGPVWAGLLQMLVMRQFPARGWWVGTLLAIAGGVALMMPGADDTTSVAAAGIALCLLSGLSYAAYSLITKRLVRDAPAASVTLCAFTVAAALAVPAAWLDSGAPVIAWSDAGAVAYVGVVTTGVAYLLFNHALRHVSAATGVTLALGEPVTAFMLAILVVGERPSSAGFGGLLLVIAGVLVVARAEMRGSAPVCRARRPPRCRRRSLA